MNESQKLAKKSWSEGRNIQYWSDKHNIWKYWINEYRLDVSLFEKWRVEPKTVVASYRVALMKHLESEEYYLDFAGIVGDKSYSEYEKEIETNLRFVRWISEVRNYRIEI